MNTKKINLILITALIVFTIFSFSPVALAQVSKEAVIKGLDKTATPAGFQNDEIKKDPSGSIATIVGKGANFIFGPVTIIFFIYILIGGYQWMIAKGNEERIGKAKKFIINGFFGITVIFFAWTLVIVVLNVLDKATNTG